jgi:hypothetical protein
MKKLFLFGIFLTMLLSGTDAFSQSDKKEMKKAIPLGGAKELITEVEFPVGNLRVKTSDGKTIRGIFQYQMQEWEPQIDYRKEKGKAYVRISAEGDVDVGAGSDDENRYDDEDQSNWGVIFPRGILHDLDVEMLAGKGIVDLSGSKLKAFEFSMTAGEVNINLRNTSLHEMEFKALAGQATLDLSGQWDNDLYADIMGGFGSITIKLPRHQGVEMEVTGILGDIDLPRMKKREGRYINEHFDQTSHNLHLDVSGGIGEVEVEWVDE